MQTSDSGNVHTGWLGMQSPQQCCRLPTRHGRLQNPQGTYGRIQIHLEAQHLSCRAVAEGIEAFQRAHDVCTSRVAVPAEGHVSATAPIESVFDWVVCTQVCERLPVMDIHWNKPTSRSPEANSGADSALLDEAETWEVSIHIKRQGRRQGTAASVYAPRFPKVKLPQ